MGDEKEILEGLKDSVINFDEERSAELAQKALDTGLDPQKAIFDGLAAGMEVVGDLFQKGEYFVPEVLMSADALYAGLNILKPHVNVDDKSKVKGEVIIGTVEGDVHDIGKNIVKLMFDIAGFTVHFTVHDLGKDVPLDRFVEEQLKTDSDIVALSAMMTTTMTTMKKVIEKIREKNPNVKIMIGGAPVTEETAKAYGADATAKDATNALSEAIKMVASLREMQK
jgi:corrinoid protein of di/trimethylamine methyltransferase